MILWRISNHDNLVGLGGENADGRWHRAARGKRIVYLSEHPALALIEVLANLKGEPRLFPERYRLMKVKVTNAVSRSAVDLETLTPDWRGAIGEDPNRGRCVACPRRYSPARRSVRFLS